MPLDADPSPPTHHCRHRLQTVQRLLASAVADPSVTVRRTILEALSRTAALESHLAQAECLRSLFVALNDESSTVRSLTIQLAGAISAANPAYVMPALRRHLMQLLSDMDHSPDSRQREGACYLLGAILGGTEGQLCVCCVWTAAAEQEHLPAPFKAKTLTSHHSFPTHSYPQAESARLLGVLICSAPKLVLPYTAPVLRALISKLRAASSSTRSSSAAAAASSTTQTNVASATSQGAQRRGEAS